MTQPATQAVQLLPDAEGAKLSFHRPKGWGADGRDAPSIPHPRGGVCCLESCGHRSKTAPSRASHSQTWKMSNVGEHIICRPCSGHVDKLKRAVAAGTSASRPKPAKRKSLGAMGDAADEDDENHAPQGAGGGEPDTEQQPPVKSPRRARLHAVPDHASAPPADTTSPPPAARPVAAAATAVPRPLADTARVSPPAPPARAMPPAAAANPPHAARVSRPPEARAVPRTAAVSPPPAATPVAAAATADMARALPPAPPARAVPPAAAASAQWLAEHKEITRRMLVGAGGTVGAGGARQGGALDMSGAPSRAVRTQCGNP